MWAAGVMVTSLLLASQTGAADSEIRVGDRRPIAFLLGTPTGELAKTRSSEIIRIVAELLKEHTNFFPEDTDPTLLSKCRGKIGCMVESVRDDYNFELAAGQPYENHLRRLAREGSAYPRYMLVLSNVAIEGQSDRLSAVLVDTDVALEVLHNAPRADKDWRQVAEGQITERSVLFGPERAEVRTPKETAQFLDRLFVRELWRIFEKTNNWEPYGTLELQTNVSGQAIMIDQEVVGTTQAGVTRLTDLMSGVRRVRLEHPNYEAFEAEIEVPRGRSALLEAVVERRADDPGVLLRSVAMWSGVGVATVGAAITTWALLRQNSDVVTYCFMVEGSACQDSSRFQTIGYDPGVADDLNPEVNPSGILTAPLGYSLVGVGATWALGTLLFGDETDAPWIQIAAGLGVGLLSYGLSAALNPGDSLGG